MSTPTEQGDFICISCYILNLELPDSGSVVSEVLLRELSNTDIDWLVATGHQRRIASGTVLLQPGEDSDVLYLLLEGALSIRLLAAEGVSEVSSSTASEDAEDREVIHISRGELVGEASLFNAYPLAAAVMAAEDSIVLSIPQRQLVTKLQQDFHFSAHFYRAIALLLSERLRQMLEMPDQIRMASNQAFKEALLVFGELRDSDVDWLLAAGRLEKYAAGKVMIQAGRSVDALSIVLDGFLTAFVSKSDSDLLTLCFECEQKRASSSKVIAELSRGKLSGMISFLDSRPSPMTIKAIKESLVLSIPRPLLTVKLQQDVGFASRFYRVLATQLLENLQMAMGLMGCPQRMYSQQQAMDEDVEYDDELDIDSLQQVSQGAARFNWMLKQLGVV